MIAASVPSGNVYANDIRQHFLHYGAGGPVLVVVPGITSPAVTWGFVAKRLAKAFDVFVLDVRGRGLSAAGAELDYGFDAMADDLAAFLQALDLDLVTVLGHSMGARTAVRTAVRNPERLSRLILVDPPVSGPGRRPYPSKLDWYVDSIRLARRGMDADAMRAFCPTWSDEHLALRAEWLHTCHEPAVTTAFDAFHAEDFYADLAGVACPADLIVAGRGGVVEPRDIEEFRSLAPAGRVAVVPDAGHMIPWDDLEGFLGAVDQLIGTTLRQRA